MQGSNNKLILSEILIKDSLIDNHFIDSVETKQNQIKILKCQISDLT